MHHLTFTLDHAKTNCGELQNNLSKLSEWVDKKMLSESKYKTDWCKKFQLRKLTGGLNWVYGYLNEKISVICGDEKLMLGLIKIGPENKIASDAIWML